MQQVIWLIHAKPGQQQLGRWPDIELQSFLYSCSGQLGHTIYLLMATRTKGTGEAKASSNPRHAPQPPPTVYDVSCVDV
jgi:hypothetical protein